MFTNKNTFQPTISIGQALILLIEKYEKNPEKLAIIQKFYLIGIKSKEDEKVLDDLLKDDIFQKFQVSKEPSVINEDSTRRYFETHLSYELGKFELGKLNIEDLVNYHDAIIELFNQNEKALSDIKQVFNSDLPVKVDAYSIEYSDAIIRLKSDTDTRFTEEEKEKYIWLMKISYLAVKLASTIGNDLALGDAGEIFLPANRGKKTKEGLTISTAEKGTNPQGTTRSSNQGILKSHSPVAYHNNIARLHYYYSNDKEFLKPAIFSYTKPADAGTYIPDSMWAIKNFNELVHPYLNAISGTLLCQFRVMLQIHNHNKTIHFFDQNKLINFLKCFTSLLTYNGGGHAFREFTAVLDLPNVKKGMSFINCFNEINDVKLLLDNDSAILKKVFDSTIEYNHAIIARKLVNEQIRNKPQ